MKEEEAERRAKCASFKGGAGEEAGSPQGKEPSPGQSLAPAGTGALGRAGFTPSGPGSAEETAHSGHRAAQVSLFRAEGEEMLQTRRK